MILKILVIVSLQITLIFIYHRTYAQTDAEIVISQEYFKKNQIHQISFYVPVNEKWINTHPAFSHQMNIKQYLLKYDQNGNCTEASWSLCSLDSSKNEIDTNIHSLENYLYFKYINNSLTRIDAISFSEINFVELSYTPHSIIRHISYVENSQLKTKNDTLTNKPKIIEIFNPYDWAVYPYFQSISIDENLISKFLINKIPILYFDEQLNSKKIIIEAYPGLSLRIL